jgi:hypothetical protein
VREVTPKRPGTSPLNYFIALSERIRIWLRDSDNLILVVLILIHLLPIWMFKYFPSQDGPAHLDSANIIHEYFQSGNDAIHKYYVINDKLNPNWTGHLIMAVLMFFVSPLVAEKILLSGYIILLPVSIYYALRVIHINSKFLIVLAFPFIYNFMFHMGFYNFSYSLPMFFFVIGYWLKYKSSFTLSNFAIFALLSLLLYFSHLSSFVLACVAVVILATWFMFFDLFQDLQKKKLI